MSEQPVSEQPVSEQPISEQPVSEQPVSEQPVSEQPVSEQAVTPTSGEITTMPLRRDRTNRPAPVPAARTTGTPPTGMTGPLRTLLGPVTGSLKLLGRADTDAEQSLRVDWPQCKAHGLCAEIAPEVIQLDEWGFPYFDPTALRGEDLATVRKAVQVCPTLALRLADAKRP
jgi:ferredoxin